MGLFGFVGKTKDPVIKQIISQRNNLIANGFEEYIFIANHDCCELCAKLHNKHFPLSKLKAGTNSPPMHKGCRCSIAAYENEEEYEAWLDYVSNGGTTKQYKRKRK